MADLVNASPTTVTQCSVVCTDINTVTWKSLWETWGHNAKQRWVINTARLANSHFMSNGIRLELVSEKKSFNFFQKKIFLIGIVDMHIYKLKYNKTWFAYMQVKG